MEMWNDRVLRHIHSPTGKLIKVNHISEEVIKGMFARVCIEVDISKPLKRKIKYMHEGFLSECLLDYKNITKIFLAVVLSPINLILAFSTLKVLLWRWRNYRSFAKLMSLMD